jgi:hypothetical protein
VSWRETIAAYDAIRATVDDALNTGGQPLPVED